MTQRLEVDLSQNMIPEPVDAYRVEESWFAVADSASDRPHMITRGLYVCKGIVIYDPLVRKGLVSHISIADDFEADMDKLVQGFGGELGEADVHLVQATHASRPGWPTLSSLSDYFLAQNPRTLVTDKNIAGNSIRSISLDLSSGRVEEIDMSLGWADDSHHDRSLNQRVH